MPARGDRAAEMWTRWPRSSASETGPRRNACVTWLEPPVAASSPTSAATAAAAAAPPRTTRRAVTRTPYMRAASTAKATSRTTIPPPSAPAWLQPTVTIVSARDRQDRAGRRAARPPPARRSAGSSRSGSRPRRSGRRRPARADRRERVHLGPDEEDDQVRGDERDQRPRQQPRGRRRRARARRRRREQRTATREGSVDRERREEERHREHRRRRQHAGPPEIPGAEGEREQRAGEDGAGEDQRRPEPDVVRVRRAGGRAAAMRGGWASGDERIRGVFPSPSATAVGATSAIETSPRMRVEREVRSAVVAAADDRDRVAARVRVLAGRRQRDVDRHGGRPARRARSAACRRGPRRGPTARPCRARASAGAASPLTVLARARHEQPDRAAGRRTAASRPNDDDRDAGRVGRCRRARARTASARSARRTRRFWPTRPAAALPWPRARAPQLPPGPDRRPAPVPDDGARPAAPALRGDRRDRDAAGPPDPRGSRRDRARRARRPADRDRDPVPRLGALARRAAAGRRRRVTRCQPVRARRAGGGVLPVLDVRLPRALVASPARGVQRPRPAPALRRLLLHLGLDRVHLAAGRHPRPLARRAQRDDDRDDDRVRPRRRLPVELPRLAARARRETRRNNLSHADRAEHASGLPLERLPRRRRGGRDGRVRGQRRAAGAAAGRRRAVGRDAGRRAAHARPPRPRRARGRARPPGRDRRLRRRRPALGRCRRPGHSDDGLSFVVGDGCFSGDTLFKDAVGGTAAGLRERPRAR